MIELLTLKEANSIFEPAELFKNIKKINIDFEQENFILFCLNSKNEVIHEEVIFKGGLNSCIVDPKTLFRIALKHNSSSLIVAHNHPSGCLKPSDDDINVFRKLKECGNILQLYVLDSIVFNKKEYYSLKNRAAE